MLRAPALFKNLIQKWKDEPLLVVAVLLALLVRVIFWVYTHRVWEDALISITPARTSGLVMDLPIT